MATRLTAVDRLWTKFNEFDVNQKLSDMCMPPVVLKYGDLMNLNRCLATSVFGLKLLAYEALSY